MPKLIMLVGPPGAGKDTYIQNNIYGYTRISQDDHGRSGHFHLFTDCVDKGHNIVISRMNFDKNQRDKYLIPAKQAGYETEIIVLHQNYETCLKRCLERKGHPTISTEESARSALATFFGKYERPTLDEADSVQFVYPELPIGYGTIIIDIDNTMSNSDHRQYFLDGPKKNWAGFFGEMCNDSVNEWCKRIVNTMRSNTIITLCSGRPDTYRKVTKDWLEKHHVFYDNLFMRPRNDSRPDIVVKEIIYDFEVRTRYSNVLFCIDDRKCVIDMYRSRGLVVLDCAGERGNF